MKSIYDAAAMLRNCISKCKSWLFTGRFDEIGDEHLPKELYCFFRWVVQGPKALSSGRIFFIISNSCWSVFNEAHDDVIQALSQLGTSDLPSNETLEEVEKIVCQLFLSKTDICSHRALRWWLFTKKQARSQQLPPTQAALHQAVLRAHYQLLVWNNNIVPNPVSPSPEGFGWKWERDEKAWIPVMTTLPPAPEAIIHLVKCKCMKERCANNRCKCWKAGLTCTDLCGCSDTGEECKNK